MANATVRKPVLGVGRTEKLSDETIPHHHHYLSFPVELTRDEFSKYQEARMALTTFIADVELFELVVLNYQEYYDVLNAYLQAYIQRDEKHYDTRRFYLGANRCLLNWLSSVRTYLDHTEASIKRRHGESSPLWQSFDQRCSNVYDSVFSYRFMYRLRNYSQHCGFPIHHLHIHTRPSAADPKRPAYSLEIGCSRDKLLTEYDGWSAQLRTEIAGLPPFIDVNSHVDAMMKALDDINISHIKEEFALLRNNATYIKEILQRIPPDQGEPGVFEIEVVQDETGKVISITNIVAHVTPINLVNAVINGRIEEAIGQFEVETI